jgi:Flp pilus assembly pilin Flp
MSTKFKAFCHDGSGVTTIEYGLIAAIVAVATLGLLSGMGNSLITFFEYTSNSMSNAVNGV